VPDQRERHDQWKTIPAVTVADFREFGPIVRGLSWQPGQQVRIDSETKANFVLKNDVDLEVTASTS
jgi:hypothetical protein